MTYSAQKWIRVTKKDKCRICSHPNWCTYTADLTARCCMRVESAVRMKNGGWLHKDDLGVCSMPVRIIDRPESEPEVIDAGSIISALGARTDRRSVERHAKDLSVSADSLLALRIAWSPRYCAWAFPMHDGQGNVVGIRLRSEDGKKWAIKGSKSGIFIPNTPAQDVVYICEGPTDTAAAVTLGLFAIGKPSCMHGAQQVVETCNRMKITRVVIVADNDGEDGPGLKGAMADYNEGFKGLWRRLWVPPLKDLRKMVQAGAKPSMILGSVSQLVWRQP